MQAWIIPISFQGATFSGSSSGNSISCLAVPWETCVWTQTAVAHLTPPNPDDVIEKTTGLISNILAFARAADDLILQMLAVLFWYTHTGP
jgi:hypothetical protein